MRRLVLIFALSACAPPPAPRPDASPDAAAEAAADVASVPDAGIDAAGLPDVVSLPDVTIEASSLDVVDVVSRPDGSSEAGGDAGVPPDINARHETMALSVLMRRTCTAGLAEGCDEIQSRTFEATCSVRGTRFSIYFLPCARGLTQCGEVFSNLDGAFASIAATSSIGDTPAQGSDATVAPGLEWVDGMGQRRQNFYVRARLAADRMRGRGISGVAGRTALADYADFYALGCPKGP